MTEQSYTLSESSLRHRIVGAIERYVELVAEHTDCELMAGDLTLAVDQTLAAITPTPSLEQAEQLGRQHAALRRKLLAAGSVEGPSGMRPYDATIEAQEAWDGLHPMPDDWQEAFDRGYRLLAAPAPQADREGKE